MRFYILPGWFSATAWNAYVHAKRVGRKIFLFCHFTPLAVGGTTHGAYAKILLGHSSLGVGVRRFLSAATASLYMAGIFFRNVSIVPALGVHTSRAKERFH